MSDYDMSISFELDSDGFMSQECPSCAKRFKVQFTQGDEKGSGPLGHCPYCGYQGEKCWWTPEQAQYIEDSVAAPLEDEMAKMARDFNRTSRGGPVRMSVKKTGGGAVPVKPLEPDDSIPRIVFACHDEPVKHDGSKAELHCIICGKRQKVDGP